MPHVQSPAACTSVLWTLAAHRPRAMSAAGQAREPAASLVTAWPHGMSLFHATADHVFGHPWRNPRESAADENHLRRHHLDPPSSASQSYSSVAWR
eukprot:8319217-Pyramimonas_sp.AAC.1